MDNYYEMYMSERCKVKALKKIIEEYESGKRYLKLQKDYRKVCDGYARMISGLKKELADSHAQTITIRNMWTDECYSNYEEYRAELRQKDETIRRLKDEKWDIKRKCDEKIAEIKMEYDDRIHEMELTIDELVRKLARAEALNNQDGTNAGIPTSRTPLDKEKRRPNTRTKTGKTKGGQYGHEKHKLEIPDAAPGTEEIIEHNPIEDGLVCPFCDCGENWSMYVPTGEYDVKYEKEIEIVEKLRKHIYYYYRCIRCGGLFRSEIAPNLKEKVQYGKNVQALALSLMNTVNASMNKTAMFIAGISDGWVTPCEGYIAKLQARAGRDLEVFRKDLWRLLITRPIIYWDDTVIMILTERACFRFYGDETIAYYIAHTHKDMDSIDDDNVLAMLGEETKVMHDHNTLNYNPKFIFQNIECNQHIQRDLKKNTDDTGNTWSDGLYKLISTTIKDRNEAVARGEEGFSKKYLGEFNSKVDNCIEQGWEENKKTPDKYGSDFERTLLNRIKKYRQNYFAWVEDFSLPVTNNLSERALRGIKSHMKISGQFESEAYADHHAVIKTYIETCRRNSLNEIYALKRLMEHNPVSVREIFEIPPE
ncbi:MAG: transposase [Lachnospiraceae bacterium]|nr:transposase [Lachnospiraceae bacterium]